MLRVGAIVGVALLLAACQSPPTRDGDDAACDPAKAGSASDAVEVTGKRLSLPTVAFDKGLNATTTERSVVRPGHGPIAQDGSLVTFAYSAYNGSTGEPIDAVGYEDPHTQALMDESSLLPGLAKVLSCGVEGSRIAAVVPPADAFQGHGNEQFGIGPDDAIIFVVDIVSVAPSRADGKDQPTVDGLPLVEVGPTGEPMITIPATAPPAELKIATLKKGGGDEVAEGVTVTIEYVGVLWANGDVFDSSWKRPDLVRVATTEFVDGFSKALVGQTVGSQVLAVIPPAFGYGTGGNPPAGISGTDTLVFVIDVLAVEKPPVAE